MKLLLQLAFLWLVWLISPWRWRRALAILFSVSAVVLVAISPLGVQIGLWGLTMWVPVDTGKAVDVIVVLGRGANFRDLRVAAAQELWEARRAPEIFASGMMDARLIVHNLMELGVPVQYLHGEECSQSTDENALFAAAILHSQGKRHILLLTDAPHIGRAFLAFQQTGFNVVLHPVSLPAQLTLGEKLRCIVREYFALTRYLFTKELKLLRLNNITEAPVEVTERIRDWKCQV